MNPEPSKRNLATLKDLWPDIANPYFKALSNPAHRK